ncbi:MAG TPA: AI-2E family transporter [Candidatus Limnocylindrales bacterium]
MGIGIMIVAGALALLLAAAQVAALVFVAILLASGLAPLVDDVRSRTPFGRTTTVGLLFALFGGLVIVLGVLVIPAALGQLDQLGQSVPGLLASARTTAQGLRPDALGSALTSLIDEVAQVAKRGAAPSADAVVAAGSIVVEVVGSVATVLTLTFFWLHERPRIQRFMLALAPTHRRGGARSAWNDIELRLGSWVRGQLFLMGLMAVATTSAYALLGLPSALVLGVIAGLFEAVPIVGPLLGAIPAVIVATTGGPQLVLAVAVVYVIVQLLESNFVVPIVMRNAVGVSPFLILVSLLVGASLGGIVGAFLAVPLAASAEIVLERLQARDVPVALEPDVGSDEPLAAEAAGA